MISSNVCHKKPVILFTGLCLLVMAFGLTACQQESYLYERGFENGCWSHQDSLHFELASSAPGKGILIDLTFTEDYPFSNLYLKLLLTAPSGEQSMLRLTETFVDSVGHWMTEGSGEIHHYSFTGFASEAWQGSGGYHCTLLQDMRADDLCGISKLGVRMPALNDH